MFRKLFRSKASKDVQVSMDYLLNFSHQKLVQTFFTDYPAFDDVIAQKRKEGADTVVIAVELLAIAFSDIIAHSRFTELERRAIEDHVLGRVEDGSDFAKAVRAFLSNCLLHRDWNKIDEHLYLYAITEVIGALRGLDKEERSNRRILAAFDDALFPPGDSGS